MQTILELNMLSKYLIVLETYLISSFIVTDNIKQSGAVPNKNSYLDYLIPFFSLIN